MRTPYLSSGLLNSNNNFMITDLSRGKPLPEGKSKTFSDHAEEMLAHFAGIDRAELLKTIVALTIMDMRYGNKREERAACDLLNLVQAEAVKQLSKPPTNSAS